MTYLLIGNKNDLAEKRQVTFDEGANFARANGLSFLETSAKDNINVKQAFLKTAMIIAGKVKNGQIAIDKSVNIPILTSLGQPRCQRKSQLSQDAWAR